MKATTKKKWLAEIAKWLRVLAEAPTMLLLIVWGGNALLALMGKPSVFAVVDPQELAQANLPSIVVAAAVYVAFNAAATWVEIKAEEIRDPDAPRIILLDRNRKRKGGGGDSS